MTNSPEFGFFAHKIMIKNFTLVGMILVSGSVAHASDGCGLPGYGVQWIADYCLLKLETDDLIAAQNCIDSESNNSFESECDQKLHYKKLMCKSAAATKERFESENACVTDPGYMGLVVRGNGL